MSQDGVKMSQDALQLLNNIWQENNALKVKNAQNMTTFSRNVKIFRTFLEINLTFFSKITAFVRKFYPAFSFNPVFRLNEFSELGETAGTVMPDVQGVPKLSAFYNRFLFCNQRS